MKLTARDWKLINAAFWFGYEERANYPMRSAEALFIHLKLECLDALRKKKVRK